MRGPDLRLDYQHRWLGTIIEDGTADPTTSTFVLANPGHVPESAIDRGDEGRHARPAGDDRARSANDPNDPAGRSASRAATRRPSSARRSRASRPRPSPSGPTTRITLSLNKRFSKNWFARGSYTYSRLSATTRACSRPSRTTSRPTAPTPTTRPTSTSTSAAPCPTIAPTSQASTASTRTRSARATFTFGLSFSAQSGMPRNYLSAWSPASTSWSMLLPRGSGGRTPTVTQFDAKIAYGRPLSPPVNLEAFIDLFNVFNQQATLMTDDIYTFDCRRPDRERHAVRPEVRQERLRRSRSPRTRTTATRSPTRRRSTPASACA